METSPEPGCEESDLSVEVGDGAVIPDNVIGLLNFRAEVQLSGDDLFGHGWREVTVLYQPVHLRCVGCSDDDHTVKLGLDAGLVK